MSMTLTYTMNTMVPSNMRTGKVEVKCSARLGPAGDPTTYSFQYTLLTTAGNITQSGASVTRTSYGWVYQDCTFSLDSSYAGCEITLATVLITANNWTHFENGNGIAGYDHNLAGNGYSTLTSYGKCYITLGTNPLSSTAIEASTSSSTNTNTLTWYESYGSYNTITTTVTALQGTWSASYNGTDITKTFNIDDGDYQCSATISVPTTAGEVTCTISGTCTNGTVDSQSTTFQVYTVPPAPSTIYIGTSSSATTTTAYVGATGKPSQLVIHWSTVDGSSYNNTITGYQYSSDSGSTWTDVSGTSVTISTPDSTTSYIVRAVGAYSVGSSSSAVKVAFIAAPASIVFTSPTSTDFNTATDVSVAWNTIAVSNATVKYTAKRGTTQFYSGTATSTTVNVLDLTVGTKTTITVTATATAICGGTTSSSSVFYVTRTSSLPAITITGLYDPNGYNVTTTTIATQIYSAVKLTWAAVTSLVTGKEATYTVKMKKNNAAQWTDYTGTTSTRSLSLSTFGTWMDCKEGDLVQFYIHATDGYTETDITTSNLLVMSKPTFSISAPSVTCTQDNKIKVGISYNNDVLLGDSLTCTTNLCYYDDADGTFITFNTTSLDQSSATSYSYTGTVTPSSSGDALQSALYTAVITNGMGRPYGKAKVTLTRKSFPLCSTSILTIFNFDYRRPITSAAVFTVSSTNANPGDSCTFTKSTEAVHKNAVGGSTSSNSNITYAYYITGNNLNNSKWTSSLSDTLPNAAKNTTVTYTVTTTITYADSATVSASSTCSILVHRWTADATSLTLISGSSSSVDCQVNLPDTKYSDYSNSYVNLQSIICKIYTRLNSTDTLIDTQTFSRSSDGTSPFSTLSTISTSKTFTAKTADYSIIAKLTITNTSGATLSVETDTVVVRISVVDVAIRSHRLGVNINDNFGITSGTNTDSTTGALTVFNDPGSTKPSIESIVDSANASPLVIKKGTSTTVSSFSILADDFLAISNLFKTAIVTLTLNSSSTEYTISNSHITSTTTQEIAFYYDTLVDLATNKTRYKLLQKAMFIGTSQTSGSCTLTAFGSLPSTNTTVKVLLTVRGG